MGNQTIKSQKILLENEEYKEKLIEARLNSFSPIDIQKYKNQTTAEKNKNQAQYQADKTVLQKQEEDMLKQRIYTQEQRFGRLNNGVNKVTGFVNAPANALLSVAGNVEKQVAGITNTLASPLTLVVVGGCVALYFYSQNK